jgi:hypothetical protein
MIATPVYSPLARNHARNDSGVGLVAVLLIVAVLGLMGGVVTTLVATGAVSKTNDLVREQAFELVQAGFEYALKRIDDGVDPDGDSRNLGSGQFTVVYSPTGVITVTSNVSAMYGSANSTYSIQGPVPGGNMADCLTVNISSAYMTTSGWPNNLRGVTLQNTCNASITIGIVTVNWNPGGSERTVRVRIKNTNVYNSWPGIPMGSPIDITDYTIPAYTTRNLTTVRFNTEMPRKNFTIDFGMTDGSSKSAFVQFIADNEAACLNVDLSASYVGGTGYTRLMSGTLTNACSSPINIEVSGVTVAWAPLSPSRTLTGISLGGSWMWSGSVNSGVPVSFWANVGIDAGDTANQEFLDFSSDIRGRNFVITYNMEDGSSQTVTKNLYEADMAACLVINTAATTIKNKDLKGEVWQNSCALRIIVGSVNTSWSGVSKNPKLRNIRVGGSTVWTGSVSSGSNVDITDVEIPGGSSVDVTRYRFSKKMSGACFSHVLTMFDGGTKSVGSFCP